MIKYNIEILKELENNNLLNVYTSPVWILKVEKIFHKGSFYLKTYVFKNLSDIKINEITFKVSYSNKEIIQKVSDISRADSYPNDPIYGCLVKLPEDYNDSVFGILINGLVIDSNLIDFSKSKNEILKFSNNPLDDKNVVYIRENSEHFLIYPRLEKNYWQCSCGKFNVNDNDVCVNCGTKKNYIKDIVEKGMEFLTLEIYLKKNPIKFNPKLNFETAYKEYISKMNDTILISVDSRDALIDIDKEKSIYDEQAALTKNKKKKNRLLAIIAVVLIAFSLYIYEYGSQTVTYTSGLVNYMTGNYEAAITDFNEVKSFANSESMVLQVKYSWAKSLYENNPETSIKKLEEIMNFNFNFKDSNDLYNDYVYSYATSLFNDGEYETAAEYFFKVEYEDSSTMYLESEYLLAKQYYTNSNQYSKAIDAMEIAKKANYKDAVSIYNEWVYLKGLEYFDSKSYDKASDQFKEVMTYKDAKDYYNESTYLYGKNLMSLKNYSSAITYFSKITSYKDSATQIKESNYQIALDYYYDKSYSNALIYFNKTKNYRDTNNKIYAIEEIIYAWSVKIYFNSSENSTSDYSSISRYSAVYIHFELNGGRPNEKIKIKLVYTMPNGHVGSYTYTYEMADASDSWLSWDNGIYTNPSYGTTGDLKVSLYNASNGKFLGSDSVYISR